VRRLLTAAVGVPLALLATFRLPAEGFFVLILILVGLGAMEYVRMLQPAVPGTPVWLVLLWLPPAAGAGFWALGQHASEVEPWLLVGGLFAVIGLPVLLLASGMPAPETLAGLGAVGFGVAYFAFPVAAITTLQRLDPWLVFLLFAITWLGDTAAYYVGSRLGRHKMAPRVSPNKSWEGAAAGFATGVIATLVWSVWRLGEPRPALILVGAATAVAAQLGDLFESLLKRSVNTKDSGALLPGHGGMLDRIDALLFASPVLLAGLWLIAHDRVRL
jgi:phosphatidate cytidylyltransferase